MEEESLEDVEIEVFQEVISDKKENVDEYDAFIETLKNDQVFSPFVINGFKKLNAYTNGRHNNIKSNIDSVLTRIVMNYFVPIVSEHQFDKESRIDDNYAITVTLDDHTTVLKYDKMTHSYNKFVIPKDNVIYIVGFCIRPNVKKDTSPLTYANMSYLELGALQFYNVTNDTYILEDLDNNICNLYFSQCFDKLYDYTSAIILFTNQADATRVLKQLILFKHALRNFYENNYVTFQNTASKCQTTQNSEPNTEHADSVNDADQAYIFDSLKHSGNLSMYYFNEFKLSNRLISYIEANDTDKIDYLSKIADALIRSNKTNKQEHLAQTLYNLSFDKLNTKQIKRIDGIINDNSNDYTHPELNTFKTYVNNRDIRMLRKSIKKVKELHTDSTENDYKFCVHYIDLAEQIIKGSRNIDTYMLDNYYELNGNSYYCKYCSEITEYKDEEKFQYEYIQSSYNNIKTRNQLSDKVYTEVSSIVLQYIVAKDYIKKNLIRSIADTVTHKVTQDDLQLKKNKSLSIEKYNASITFLITIYIFAILTVIIGSHDTIKYAVTLHINKIGGKQKEKNTKTVEKTVRSELDNLNIAFGLIKKLNSGLITILNYTTDIIKTMFINDAYSWAKHNLIQISLEPSVKTTILEHRQSFADTLKKDIKGLVKLNSNDVILLNKYVLSDTQNKYYINFVNNSIYENKVMNCYDSDSFVITCSRDPIIKLIEETIYNNRKLQNNNGVYKLIKYKYWPTMISKLYCTDNAMHKFDKYVCLNEANVEEILDKPGAKIIDEMCSKCNQRMSQMSHTVNINEVYKQFTIEAFTKYYTNRCPVDNLHEYMSDKNVCKKCGFGEISADEFLKKYLTNFIEKENKLKQENSEYLAKLTNDHSISDTTYNSKPKIKNIKRSFSYITMAAKMLNISMEQLMNLGATDYKDINAMIVPDFNEVSNIGDGNINQVNRLSYYVRYINSILYKNNIESKLEIDVEFYKYNLLDYTFNLINNICEFLVKNLEKHNDVINSIVDYIKMYEYNNSFVQLIYTKSTQSNANNTDNTDNDDAVEINELEQINTKFNDAFDMENETIEDDNDDNII